ncbi:MAG: hypothetical protein QOE36_464 [Gaiellaceae bacterium]|jgi:hypothetical protein|nr:hypothetical protein [Gaiellaceae bacterium]
MLAADGLDATLERLYDAGVSVALEEFKGLRPVERPGLELHVRAADFENPLSARQYEAHTGGSSGAARPILIDLDLLEHESAYHALFFAAAGASDGPLAIWQPAPPGAVGIKTALIGAKLGRPAERWFSQTPVRSASLRHAAFTRATIITAGAFGARVPSPEYTPTRDAARVAVWLAAKRADGMPGVLVTTASAGVRICTAALAGGLDVSGTLFVLGGEPYTREKAAIVARTGSRAACHYAMAEAGLIGVACQSPDAPDDVHLASDKIATIQRDRRVDAGGTTVGALFHTTLLPASPTVMLNVESGDYGVREERDCGCGVVPAAFRSHLHTIRSYEKLTSEGMNFLGCHLLGLLEHVLPNRFGGHPTDYQLVEREHEGLPTVSLVVRQAVGDLDDVEVVGAMLDFLRSRGHAQRLMAEVWAQGRTIRVVRGDPHVTAGGKVLPLLTLGG